jgi:hypothetical protein
VQALQHRRDELNQAAPGQNLDEMAAAGGHRCQRLMLTGWFPNSLTVVVPLAYS